MTKTVVALDPGKTTGAVYAQMPYTNCTASCTQVQGIEPVVHLLDSYKPDLVIAEQFRLQHSKALQLSGQVMFASEVLGAVKNYCHQHSIKLLLQMPFTKNTVSDKFLKIMGLWERTTGLPHARDAARHLVYYLLQEQLDVMTALWKAEQNNTEG
jgi:hypothetical protein